MKDLLCHFRILGLVALLFGSRDALGEAISRAELLAQAQLPAIVALPAVPPNALLLQDAHIDQNSVVEIRLSCALPEDVAVRRVSRNDGRLYLQLYSKSPLSGAEVKYASQRSKVNSSDGSIWLAITPRIGMLPMVVSGTGNKLIRLNVPTTLVEVRGRQIFLNGEVFLMKGATGKPVDEEQAKFVHGLGLNTLRGFGAVEDCQRYGFMNIASLNAGEAVPKTAMAEDDEKFQKRIEAAIGWLKENAVGPIVSPTTLILQLGNERTAGGDAPGTKPLTKARRHSSQLLAVERNFIKPLAPTLPVGYSNQDLGFLTPDCMDVYMHNSFLDKDRYKFPWADFIKWQGCLPPDGSEGKGRPFINSEFGANHYLCQAYHSGPNNPFLEKLHAWNLPNRWAEFMKYGTVGGCIYRLDDLEKPVDQGCSCFGIVTHEGKPKLACWEVAHMWRDFEVQVDGNQLAITYKRDYWARDCQLIVTPKGKESRTTHLDDFAPRSKRTIDFGSVGRLTPEDVANGLRWELSFTTHSGLPNRAVGAFPQALERAYFLDSLKSRDTYPFLSELFDTEVLRANGKPAPGTLAEMTDENGIVPIVLRKPNGVAYLLVISREKPAAKGPLMDGLTIDLAFTGKVERIDDITGQSIDGSVDAIALKDGGLQLRNIQAARIPGPIGQRSSVPFKLPIYRITPR